MQTKINFNKQIIFVNSNTDLTFNTKELIIQKSNLNIPLITLNGRVTFQDFEKIRGNKLFFIDQHSNPYEREWNENEVSLSLWLSVDISIYYKDFIESENYEEILNFDLNYLGINLSKTEYWKILKFHQEIELNDIILDVDASSKLSIGQTTAFNDLFNKIIFNPETTLENISFFLEKNHFSINLKNDHSIVFSENRSSDPLNFLIYFNDQVDKFIQVYLLFPININENSMMKTAVTALDFNLNLDISSFQMDSNDGELRLKSHIPAENWPDHLMTVLTDLLTVYKDYYTEILKLNQE